MFNRIFAGACACAFAACLAGCSTATNGDVTIAGFDVGAALSADIKTATSDAQALIAAEPAICAKIAAGTALGLSDLALAQSVMTVPPKTVAQLNTLASQLAGDCAAANAIDQTAAAIVKGK
jgi:hypothetical protein